jgi:hypothetical protein
MLMVLIQPEVDQTACLSKADLDLINHIMTEKVSHMAADTKTEN